MMNMPCCDRICDVTLCYGMIMSCHGILCYDMYYNALSCDSILWACDFTLWYFLDVICYVMPC